jgi:hypothetical protein
MWKSRDRGATARLRFTGASIAWATALGPGRGRAQVWINGVLRETIDLDAPTLQPRRLAWVGRWAKAAPRTIVIKIVGRDGGRVDVDGFAVVR